MDDRILAAVMPAPRRPIEIREFPRPDLPAASALLKTERAEVCGTDLHLWHGRLAGVPYPIIPGHVSAGTLAAIRGPLTGLDGSLLREGDRAVFFDVHRTCGRARPQCLRLAPRVRASTSRGAWAPITCSIWTRQRRSSASKTCGPGPTAKGRTW